MHLLSCRSIHITVEYDNTTEDRHRIRFIGIVPRCFNIVCLTDTTRVHVLESHYSWTIFEITDNTDSSIRVTDIVEGQFLTVKLFG